MLDNDMVKNKLLIKKRFFFILNISYTILKGVNNIIILSFHHFYTEFNGNMPQKLTINLGGNIPFFLRCY
ncbi:hypothetical protein DQF84_21015 [Escherichia coli]|nr:hypothetical protein [Escherichia coli]EGD7262419.1 hypothetical protein [Escherichia coli]